MKKFKDFNIKPQLSSFTGDKIKVDKILNTEIIIHQYKIDESVKKPGTKYLTLQIEKSGTRHILFTGSTILISMIEQVPKEHFPFKTTIVRESEHLEFT